METFWNQRDEVLATLSQVKKRLKRESQEGSGLERWDVWTPFRDPCFEAFQSSSRTLTNRKQGMTCTVTKSIVLVSQLQTRTGV